MKKWLLEYQNNDEDGPFRGRSFDHNGDGFTTEWMESRPDLVHAMMKEGFSHLPTHQRNWDLHGHKGVFNTTGWDF